LTGASVAGSIRSPKKGGCIMKWIAGVLLMAALMVDPVLAGDPKAENFEVKTTGDLLALCTASPEDPLYSSALHFCHGYLVGAFHYYTASTSGPNATRIVCLPENRPSRNEIIKRFVEWTNARPEYWKELPVETEFRFLTETWPCDK
jgi:hypothetical protein